MSFLQACILSPMPSPIYRWVGRYAHAVESNQKAVEVDENYIAPFRVMAIADRMVAGVLEARKKNYPPTAMLPVLPMANFDWAIPSIHG